MRFSCILLHVNNKGLVGVIISKFPSEALAAEKGIAKIGIYGALPDTNMQKQPRRNGPK